MWKILARIRTLLKLKPYNYRKMEITKSNFKEKLPLVESAIEDAIFLAIDGEFTGLNAYKGVSHFDLPHERYEKIQESAQQFLLVQFGLCTFHYDAKTDTYSNQAFNFYVWPRPYNRQAPDPRFLCQTTSIDFLIQQGFDFNKLYREGISYLRPAEIDKLRAGVTERQGYRRLSLTPGNDQRENIVVPPEQEDFLKLVHDQIEKFMSSPDQTLELPKGNAFQRRLIYQTVKQKFADVSLQSINKTGGDRVIVAVKADEEERKRLGDLKDKIELSDLDAAFGFSKVIQKITESRKMVVGHNMILDIAHTLNQFCGPLPDSYQDFKSMSREVFPNILDTKLMANTIPFKDEISNSSLEGMMEIVSKEPFKMPDCPPKNAENGYHLSSTKYHEAGYDAFATGMCLIAMSNRLGSLCGPKEKSVLPTSHHIKPFLNKLYIMRVADIPYMNLAGEDVNPDRSHVFHIQFPHNWKRTDLDLLFSPFGRIFVSWIDDASAFISISDRPDKEIVLKQLQTSTTYKITTYKKYQELKELSKTNNISGNLTKTPSNLHCTPTTHHQPSCGITPTMEKSTLSFDSNNGEARKRPISPDPVQVKRPKSVGDDLDVAKQNGAEVAKQNEKEKLFDEPKWD